MSTSATGTLDTETKNAVIATITITTETLLTLYAFAKTGSHGECRLIMEVSPDSGVSWIEKGSTLAGEGSMTMSIVATKARIKVAEAESSTSTMDIHLLAR